MRISLTLTDNTENVILELIDLRQCNPVIIQKLLRSIDSDLQSLGNLSSLRTIDNSEVQSFSRISLPFLHMIDRNIENQCRCLCMSINSCLETIIQTTVTNHGRQNTQLHLTIVSY